MTCSGGGPRRPSGKLVTPGPPTHQWALPAVSAPHMLAHVLCPVLRADRMKDTALRAVLSPLDIHPCCPPDAQHDEPWSRTRSSGRALIPCGWFFLRRARRTQTHTGTTMQRTREKARLTRGRLSSRLHPRPVSLGAGLPRGPFGPGPEIQACPPPAPLSGQALLCALEVSEDSPCSGRW